MVVCESIFGTISQKSPGSIADTCDVLQRFAMLCNVLQKLATHFQG